MASNFEMTFLVLSVVGIIVYLAVALSSVILAAEEYSRNMSRLWVWREILLSIIVIFQLVGLVGIMNGTSDYSLWTINRFVWLAFGLVSVALAARALRGWLRRTFAVRIDRILNLKGGR